MYLKLKRKKHQKPSRKVRDETAHILVYLLNFRFRRLLAHLV